MIIDITANTGNVDFYTTYAKYNFSKKYLVRIAAGVTLMGDTALNFSSIPFLASIKIVNYGNVLGSGGDGGRGNVINGTINCATGPCYLAPFFGPNDGKKGGSAIATKTGVTIQVDNYGFVAGGGGGGGGGVGTNNNLGGGGGGGAGSIPGYGGPAGIEYHCVNLTCAVLRAASPGTIGTSTTGGIGGAPSAGSAYGGNGGGLGQPGQNGLGNGVPGTGGTAGKAITGGSGNSINNIGSGQSLGVVD